MYDKASDLDNDFLAIYFIECNELPDARRNKMEHKYDPAKLFLEKYNYEVWFENKEFTDKEESTDKKESVDLPPMPALVGDEEEVKEGKVLKTLTRNKL